LGIISIPNKGMQTRENLHDKPIEELSVICPNSVAHGKAKKIVEKLQKEIPRQQYEVKIKCCLLGQSTKVIHQVTIKPMKKDFAGVLKG
jgi:translation elongation factor EF-4